MPNSPPFVRRPAVWTSWRVMTDPFRFYAQLRARYGDTFTLHAVNGDVVCSCDPAFVRDVLKLDSTASRPFAVDAAAPLLGRNGLLLLAGDAHRQERRLLTPPFHGRRMRAYGHVIRETAEEVLSRWTDGAEISARADMLDISFRVIVRAVFGVVDDEAVARWVQAVRALVDGFNPLLIFVPALQRLPFGPGPRFAASRGALDQLLYDEIAARRASGARGDDILSMMLDAAYEGGGAMTDLQLRDELVTLLFAGHETTQVSMAWALYRLARRPGALARLQAELDATDGSPEALEQAPYLGAVVQETLRLEPIVPDIIRTLTEPRTLGGYDFPAGTHVSFLAGLVHQREDLYPEPEAFRPERFLERKFAPHEFLSFGGGVRRCIGAALATYEMKVVLGTLLRAVDVESLSEERSVRRSVAMGTSGPVLLRVRRRDQGAQRRPLTARSDRTASVSS
ncbi:MAG: cytochrome P450 [Myxococcota bacterium]